MLDFTGTIAVASTTAAMLFLIAVTLGLLSPSPPSAWPVEVGQTIAQQN